MNDSAVEAPRLDAKVLNEIDLALEELYPAAKEAGASLAKSKMKNTQVRGLENLIVSTPRFSEIINYIKNQVGKEPKAKHEWQTVGPILLDQLERVEAKAAEIAGEHPSLRLEVKRRLARGWARQVVAHYLYGKRMDEGSRA